MKVPRPSAGEPTDPDVCLHSPPRSGTGRSGPAQASVVAVVALGGALGGAARYGASALWPTPPGGFPWTTLGVNVTGCAVIGVFMVLTGEVWSAHRLVRPFFGTGVLGGFTTFSTYVAGVAELVAGGRAGLGPAYLALTVVAASAAVWTAVWTTRLVARPGLRAGGWPTNKSGEGRRGR